MKISKIVSLFIASVMTIGLVTSSNAKADTTDGTIVDKYTMRDNMTTTQIVKDMGLGWNLGNTFDAFGDWIQGKEVKDFETCWGAPVTTKAMIDGVHNSGFNSVRIPVAWSNLMADDYTISPKLFDRVEEVANYALDDNMYVIINIHYDRGWTLNFSKDYDGTMKRYQSIWTQISNRFAKYGDHLIFESQNEEGHYEDIWNQWGADQSGKPKALDILNRANQAFVDLIRSTGGNNAKRHLLIAGYSTNIDISCDPLYKMPNDPQNRCALSIHYYAPADFAIIDKDCDWAKARATWGTDEDRQYLANEMNMLKVTYIDKGIPVIMGEYSVCGANKTPEMKRLFVSSVCKAAHDVGVCPMLWDVGSPDSWYDRATCKFRDPELLRQLQVAGGVTTTNTATATDTTVATDTTATATATTATTTATNAKTRITVKVTNLWADISIAGVKFSPKWGSDLMASLAADIKVASFPGYTLESVTSDANSVTLKLTTNDQLSSVPAGFTKGLDWSSGYADVSVQAIS